MKKRICLIIISLLAALYIFPVIVTIYKSLQFNGSVFTLKQYGEFFFTNHTAMHYFWNSMLYAVVITAGSIIISFPLGFLFAKVAFKGRDIIFFFFILVMMLPFQATLLPNYIQLHDMKLLNTPYALILPMIFSPFPVFLFRQFIIGIPDELIEYTLLETSSILKLLRLVILPHIKTAVIALLVLVFCESWNMVEQAIIFASETPDIMPLSVVLTQLPEDVTYAGATIYLYPVLLLYILFYKPLQKSMEEFRW